MEKLGSYEQYAQVLAAFKEGRARCGTNKMQTREELTALIEAGKLWYEEEEDTLWFLSDEKDYYTASFYVPSGGTIYLRPQDKDVLTELTGNASRYESQWDEALVAAGWIKRDRRVEVCCRLSERIDTIREQAERVRAVWQAQGFSCRKAVKADYPAIRKLLEKMIGRERYTIISLTDAELETMEREGTGIVACDPEGNIRAATIYFKKRTVAYSYISASDQLGLGSWTFLERAIVQYQAGCTKELGWIREDNLKSLGLSRHFREQSGKFYWQFVLKSEA